MLKLCSELDIYYKREGSHDFVHHISSTVITPLDSTPLILLYSSHIFNQPFPMDYINKLIAKEFMVIFFTDKLPKDALIHESLVYIVAQWRYFDPITIKNLNIFSAVGGWGSRGEKCGIQVARAFRKPFIRNTSDLEKIRIVAEKEKEEITILFDTIFECGDRGLGDILLTTAIVKGLKKRFNAKITYAVRKPGAPLLEGNPDIDHIVTDYKNLDRQKYTYHLPLIRHTENYKIARNRQNRIDSMADLFMVQLSNEDKHPFMYLTDIEKAEARRKVGQNGRRKIGINVEATSSSRRWIPSYLTKLLQKLGRKNDIYLFGTGERFKYEAIPEHIHNYVGKETLRSSAAMVAEMDMMIVTDSIFSHLAAAFDIPQVSFFTTIPALWRNKYYRSVAVEPTTTCAPCCDFQFITQDSYDACDRFGVPPCVKSITPDRVLAAVKLCEKKYLSEERNKRKYIAINRSSGLGDILMITSLIHSVRKENPDAFITIRTNHPELFDNNPDINEVIMGRYIDVTTVESMFYGYDQVLNFDYCLESPGVAGDLGKISDKDYMTVPRLDLIYRWANMKMPKNPKLQYYVSDDECAKARRIVGPLANRPTVVYVMNSTSPFRTYPIDLALETMRGLLKDYNVIAVGNNLSIWQQDHKFNETYYHEIEQFDDSRFVDLVDRLDIRTLLAIMKLSHIVISPDTGTLHMAAALDKKCIGLFGNIDPSLRTSYYKNCISLYKKLPCAIDCGDRGRMMKDRVLQCPDYDKIAKHHGQIGAQCMRAITPTEIITVVDTMLTERGV